MALKAYSHQEKEHIKEALLTAVLQSLAERGLIHSSIDILCKRVGISKTFFYTLFPSKEKLILQALRYQQPKLLNYAQQLMNSPDMDWKDAVSLFLQNCCYGAKTGIAVLSIEEEQEIYRSLSQESFYSFQKNQLDFYTGLLEIFGLPKDTIDPRLFGNLALSMMMIYKGIPRSLPFLFQEVAIDMVNFQINALVSEMERIKVNNQKLK